MNTGEILIERFGLKDLTYIKYRKILTTPKVTLVIYFNSYRPQQPLTNRLINKFPLTSFFRGDDKELIKTPCFDLRDYNGMIDNKFIVTVDLSGMQFARQLVYENETERGRLVEFLHLSDLKSKGATSKFVLKFADERRGIMGSENSVSKLVGCKLNVNKDYVDFIWKSKSTDKYGPDHRPSKVDPKNGFKIIPNPQGVYTIILRIYDVVQWLGTYPDKTIITRKDVKDILSVADLKAFSNSPAFHYQGSNWNLSQIDGSIFPTDIPNPHWKKYHGDGQNFLDKHMSNIFMQLSFWSNNMASMLTKQFKEKGLLTQ